jgi:hypothetical protein
MALTSMLSMWGAAGGIDNEAHEDELRGDM